jgi:serine/threonine-protein kinase
VVRYRLTIDSLSATREWTGETAISPDGEWIVRAMGPRRPLQIRRRDALGFTTMAGSEGGAAPFFSPDGTRIGYFAENTLRAIPVAGGPSEVIADSLAGLDAAFWGDDGYIYRSLLETGAPTIGRALPKAGAPIEAVTVLDSAAGEFTHLLPERLPGGGKLLFHVELRDGRRMIAVGDVPSRRHTRLLEGIRARFVPGGYLLYTTNDGRLWVAPFDPDTPALTGTAILVADRIPGTVVGPTDFAISASGTLVHAQADSGTQRELTWVSRDGSRRSLDSTWKGEFGRPAISPDGRRVAVAIRDGRTSQVWLRSVAGREPAVRFTTQHEINLDPAWTPDGRWLSYLVGSSIASATGDVWRQPADGGGRAEPVLRSERPISEHEWHRDGDVVVRTTTGVQGAGDVLRLRPGRDPAPIPMLASSRSEWTPSLSPDGRWLAYVSNVSGRDEVYVSPYADPASARWVISTSGGYAPRWSPRGDEIFYVDMRSQLVAVRVATAPNFSVQESRTLFDASDFVQLALSRRTYDVTADSQQFLMVQRAGGAKGGELVVVEHWVEELRRK